MEWQPIETAPKDVGDILFHNSEHNEMFVCYWDGVAWAYSPKHALDTSTGETKWMPLPQPPEAQ